MNKINIETLATTTEGTVIDVYLSYKDGKDGFGRANMEPKGYVLHIQPVKRERQEGGIVITSFSGWSGVKGMLEETKRFSQKRMQQLADSAQGTDLYKNGLAQVLERNGLSLKETEAVSA
jgi:hypothetical protein